MTVMVAPDTPLQESITVNLMENFTGTVTDVNGVVYYYVNGTRVPGPQHIQTHLANNPNDRAVHHTHTGSLATGVHADTFVKTGRDRFGHKFGGSASTLAAQLTAHPQNIKQLVAASGANTKFLGTHYQKLQKMIAAGHVVKIGNDFALAPQHHGGAAPTPAPVAAPAPPAAAAPAPPAPAVQQPVPVPSPPAQAVVQTPPPIPTPAPSHVGVTPLAQTGQSPLVLSADAALQRAQAALLANPDARAGIYWSLKGLSDAELQTLADHYKVTPTAITTYHVAQALAEKFSNAGKAANKAPPAPAPASAAPQTAAVDASSLQMAAANATIQAVAQSFARTPSPSDATLQKHIESVRQALNVLSPAERSQMALQHGLDPATSTPMDVAKAIVHEYQGSGFTGTIIDSMDREYYFVNGRRVPGRPKGKLVSYRHHGALDEKEAAEHAKHLGKDSAGHRMKMAKEDYELNGTKAASFKSWFGDWEHNAKAASKVVDPVTGQPKITHPVDQSQVVKDGMPITVYHGTPWPEFDEFKKSAIAKGTNKLLYGPGFYFTDSYDIVSSDSGYAKRGSGLVNVPRFPDVIKFNGKNVKDLNDDDWALVQALWNEHKQSWQSPFDTPSDAKQGLSGGSNYDWERLDGKSLGPADPLLQKNPVVASVEIIPHKGHIFKVYLNIRKPFDINKDAVPTTGLSDKEKAKFPKKQKTLINGKKWHQLDDSDIDKLYEAYKEEASQWATKYDTVGDFKDALRLDEVGLTGLSGYYGNNQGAGFKNRGLVITQSHDAVVPDSISYNELTRYMTKSGINRHLAKQGYDGITHIGRFGARAGLRVLGVDHHRVWIAFNPNQIKSADNRGTFDTKSKNIKESLDLFDEMADDEIELIESEDTKKKTDLIDESEEPARIEAEAQEGLRDWLGFGKKKQPSTPGFGFSGIITDSLGRKYHFVDGHRVKSTEHAKHVHFGGESHEYEHHEILRGGASDKQAPAHAEDADDAFAQKLFKSMKAVKDYTDKELYAPKDVLDRPRLKAAIAQYLDIDEKSMDSILKALAHHEEKTKKEETRQEELAVLQHNGAPVPLSGGELADRLAKGKVAKSKPINKKSQNHTDLITMEDGTRAVWKPEVGENHHLRDSVKSGYWKREVAASEIAQLLGMGDLVPVTVARHGFGGIGSAQHFQENALEAAEFTEDTAYDGPEDLARAAALDLLFLNTDRHAKNWMLKDLSKLKLIDNGLGFPDTHEGHFKAGAQGLVRKASGGGRPVMGKHRGGPLPPPSDSLPLPAEVADWDKHTDKVRAIMKHVGLSEKETELTVERLHDLAHAAKNGKTILQVENVMWHKAETTGTAAEPDKDPNWKNPTHTQPEK